MAMTEAGIARCEEILKMPELFSDAPTRTSPTG